MRHDSPSLFASKERKASLEVPGSAGNEEHEGPSKAETMQAEHVSPAPTQSNDVKEALGMTPVVEEAGTRRTIRFLESHRRKTP